MLGSLGLLVGCSTSYPSVRQARESCEQWSLQGDRRMWSDVTSEDLKKGDQGQWHYRYARSCVYEDETTQFLGVEGQLITPGGETHDKSYVLNERVVKNFKVD